MDFVEFELGQLRRCQGAVYCFVSTIRPEGCPDRFLVRRASMPEFKRMTCTDAFVSMPLARAGGGHISVWTRPIARCFLHSPVTSILCVNTDGACAASKGPWLRARILAPSG